MPALYTRLDLLRTARRTVRLAALGAALDAAEPHETDPLVAELLELDPDPDRPTDPAALEAIVRAWPRLSAGAKRATLGSAGEGLGPLLARLAGTTEGRAAALAAFADAAADAARDAEPGSLDPPAHAVGVAGPDPDRLAAGVLAALGRSERERAGESDRPGVHLAPSAPARPILDALPALVRAAPTGDPDARAALDRLVADAAATFEDHRHPGAVAAITDLAHRAGPLLGAWLARDGEAGHLALRAAARKMGTADVSRTIAWLGVPALAPAALRAIEAAGPGPGLDRFLARAHLLRARGRADRLAKLRDWSALLRATRAGDRPSDDADETARRRSRDRLTLAAVAAPAPARAHAALLLGDPNPTHRLLAVRLLAGGPASPEADEALLDFAFDADERVASAATAALLLGPSEARRRAHRSSAGLLVRSPHPGVRRLAGLALAGSAGPRDHAAASESTLDPVRLRRELRLERGRVLRDLESRIASSDPRDAIGALAAAARLRVVGEIARAVLHAADRSDAFVASKAMLALGTDADRPAVRTKLSETLEHPDGRVAASAVEALASAGRLDRLPWRQVLDHPTARVRANAIRAALIADGPAPAGADGSLAEMLGDPRPAHRLSGLWVAERVGAASLADRVAHLLRADPDERVRERARRCGRRLLAEMRQGWAEPKPGGWGGPMNGVTGGGDGAGGDGGGGDGGGEPWVAGRISKSA